MKSMDDYRNELNKVIEENGFDMSCEAVVRKSLEIEKKLYASMKQQIKN